MTKQKAPSDKTKKMAEKYGVRLTRKVNGKRQYKSSALIKAQVKRAMKAKKSKDARKSKFGAGCGSRSMVSVCDHHKPLLPSSAFGKGMKKRGYRFGKNGCAKQSMMPLGDFVKAIHPSGQFAAVRPTPPNRQHASCPKEASAAFGRRSVDLAGVRGGVKLSGLRLGGKAGLKAGFGKRKTLAGAKGGIRLGSFRLGAGAGFSA